MGQSSVTGDESITFTDNMSFDGTERGGKMTTNGQLWIGSTASRHVKLGSLTSSDGSVTVGYSSPNITLTIPGGTTVGKTITGDIGGPLSPTSGNWNIFSSTRSAGTNPIQTSGSGSTLAIILQRSQAIASTDLTKVGLSNFNNTHFSVDTNGFVSQITGGFAWVDVTTATQNLSVQTGYVTDHTNVTYTLPATANLGDQIRIVGKLGITTIAQNANQQIVMSSASSTVGVGGSVAGTNVGDCVWLVCITAGASTIWRGESFVGNWTVT